MALRTITSTNSVFTLTIAGLFDAPVQLDGYAADTAFAADAIPTAETHMGVDGKMSAGYIHTPVKMKIHLAADSFSTDIFDQWFSVQKAEREIYFADATVDLPGVEKSYTLTKGALTNYKNFPDVKKTLADVEYEITWESVTMNSI